MRRIRAFLPGLLLLAATAIAQAQFNYVVTNGAITITEYTGVQPTVTLPASMLINGTNLPVVGLGADAFFNNDDTTSITIPASITNIADLAFEGAYGLTALNVNVANPYFITVGGVLFNHDQTILLGYPPGRAATTYSIPVSVTNIGIGAFIDCFNLTTVSIPLSVTTIGSKAFQLSFALGSVTIPNSVTSIGDLAFAACSDLTRATIGSAVTNFGKSVFANCSLLSSVTLSNGIPAIGANAFAGAGLTSITLPASITNIGALAFTPCVKLTAFNVDPANPVYSSASGVLFDHNQSTLIQYPGGKTAPLYTVPSTVTGIAASAFASAKVANVTLPNSLTSLGDFAFSQAGSLTNVNFPSALTNIGSHAFENCHLLTGVVIPNGVATLGTNAFYHCDSLTTAMIPASVTTIGDSPFGFCLHLAAITVDPGNPNYVSIDGVLFDRNVTTLIQYTEGRPGSAYTIPSAVTNLGERAFAFSSDLATIYFPGNAPVADSTVFIGMGATTVYYLPNTLGWGTNYAGLPDAPWNPVIQTAGAGFGFNNGKFGFTISRTPSLTVVVSACTNLVNPVWLPLQTVTLTNGSYFFSESAQPLPRFYSLRFP